MRKKQINYLIDEINKIKRAVENIQISTELSSFFSSEEFKDEIKILNASLTESCFKDDDMVISIQRKKARDEGYKKEFSIYGPDNTLEVWRRKSTHEKEAK